MNEIVTAGTVYPTISCESVLWGEHGVVVRALGLY